MKLRGGQNSLIRKVMALTSLVVTGLVADAAIAATPLRPLETAVLDPESHGGAGAELAFARTRAAGASAVRIAASWQALAPQTPPDGFRPTDPDDPAYRWVSLDQQVRLAVEHGLKPIVSVQSAPAWAFRTFEGFPRPDPRAYGAFALAAARRYDGRSADLPRVHVWQAWNEPNKVSSPALKPGAPDWYRAIVNAFSESVHKARADNVVVAGGLSPFGITTAVAPLAFMRSVLCVGRERKPQATCGTRAHLDVWSAHPYTVGGPTHHAYRPDDVSIGDLSEMRAVLDGARRLHHVVSAGPVRFWVTEFGWDTNPPDPKGVPLRLHARWVAEALYRMWDAGVSLVTWYLLRDDPIAQNPYQSGLYFRGATPAADRPKPSLTAFRFPFVGLPISGRVLLWGRTPGGEPGSVVVEQRASTGWTKRVTLEANRFGIFSAEVQTAGVGDFRARLADGSASSLPFALKSPPDRVFQPFGS